jgi:CubicO group peptidase (beta-lactamase class C family)
VLARGGVVGGSSAGASILASYLLRGAREGNTIIMAPGYEAGFAFLRGVAIDQHVVARERLPDLADSLMPRRPDLLGISEDEGTAWVVKGDVAEIIGRNKAFVYGGKDPTDSGKPFLTLRPGDRYNLAARRVVHRAIDDSPLTRAFVDSLFGDFVRPSGKGATVLVAEAGKILVNASYGIPPQSRYMPTTTVPNFPLGGLSDGFNASLALMLQRDGKLSVDTPLADGASVTVRQFLTGTVVMPDGSKQLAQLLERVGGAPYGQLVSRRIFGPIGAHKTVAGTDGQLQSNVDEMYRWALGLEGTAFTDDTASAKDGSSDARASNAPLGWNADSYHGLRRLSEYGIAGGKRNAFVRIPERRVSIIILTGSDDTDAKGIAERIAERLLFTPAPTRSPR